MNNHRTLLWPLTLAAMLVTLLLTPGAALAGKLKVVATLPSLAAIAAEVGGDDVEVVTLATKNEDPHFVDPRPNYVLELNSADLIVFNGMELEVGWLPPLLTQCRNPGLVAGKPGHFDASAFITPQGVPTGKVERSQGDVHASGNPHYLFDARSGARVAAALAERMAELDPAHEDGYLERGDRMVAELETFAREQATRFGELSDDKRRIVAYHASLGYLKDWLGLHEAATIEPLPGVAPDPGHVAAVLKTIKTDRVPLIVQERFYPSSTAEKLAELSGARLIMLDGNADFAAGERYIDYLRRLTDALYEPLAG